MKVRKRLRSVSRSCEEHEVVEMGRWEDGKGTRLCVVNYGVIDQR